MENLDYNAKDDDLSNDIYFSNSEEVIEETPAPARTKKKKKKKKSVASTYMFFVFVIIASMLLSIYAIMCMNDILAITKTKASVTVTLTDQVDSSSEMINKLYDCDLITCKNFCIFFVMVRDSIYSSSKVGAPYEAGVYYLNGKMGLEGMLLTLQGGTTTSETITLTFPEGYTVPEIIDRLVDNDVCDKTSLLSVIQSTSFSYSLVADLEADENVPYRLEGYLFPDTYEFYIGENASSVIKKFLENGDNKMTEEYRERAEELGLTIYEVMTIASIIEKEAASDEQMATISAVIHNRLADTVNFPTLGCQSTADYITNKVSSALSTTSAHTADYYMSYYNTNSSSTVVGLPAGPICNPGIAAIEAALYPDDSNANFFFHDTDGNLYTAKTYSEFKTKVETYAPYLSY